MNMCMCLYVHVCVCMYLCSCMCVSACICVFMYVCVCTYVFVFSSPRVNERQNIYNHCLKGFNSNFSELISTVLRNNYEALSSISNTDHPKDSRNQENANYI